MRSVYLFTTTLLFLLTIACGQTAKITQKEAVVLATEHLNLGMEISDLDQKDKQIRDVGKYWQVSFPSKKPAVPGRKETHVIIDKKTGEILKVIHTR